MKRLNAMLLEHTSGYLISISKAWFENRSIIEEKKTKA